MKVSHSVSSFVKLRGVKLSQSQSLELVNRDPNVGISLDTSFANMPVSTQLPCLDMGNLELSESHSLQFVLMCHVTPGF